MTTPDTSSAAEVKDWAESLLGDEDEKFSSMAKADCGERDQRARAPHGFGLLHQLLSEVGLVAAKTFAQSLLAAEPHRVANLKTLADYYQKEINQDQAKLAKLQ